MRNHNNELLRDFYNTKTTFNVVKVEYTRKTNRLERIKNLIKF